MNDFLILHFYYTHSNRVSFRSLGPYSAGTSLRSTLSSPERSQSLPFLPYPENLSGYAGDVGFDPLGMSSFVPMDYLRESELKHGRIAMLAVTGFIGVDLGWRIYPLPEAYKGLTSVTAHDALVDQGAMSQIFLWIAILEMISWIAIAQMLGGSGRKPGDYGFDPLGILKGASEEEVMDMQTKELKNGRLAMLAFGGVVTQAVLTNGPFPYV